MSDDQALRAIYKKEGLGWAVVQVKPRRTPPVGLKPSYWINPAQLERLVDDGYLELRTRDRITFMEVEARLTRKGLAVALKAA